MKTLAAVVLAAALAAGTASTANAFGISSLEAPISNAEESLHVGPDGTVHDRCHGMSSGTAHRLCGTATCGPVGGLF